MNKTLVIGLDGTTLDLISPWVEQGRLPNIAKIMDTGVCTRLQSVMPVLSPAAWSSFMTGMNPGKHGVFDFVYRDPSSYHLRPVNRTNIKAGSIWKILSDYGYRVGVINVPLTYPPESVNGFLISGLGTPNHKSFSYPPELSAELITNGYRVNKKTHYNPHREKAYLEDVYDLTESQFQTALQLIKNEEWDFFMTVFYETDQIAAYFWRHYDSTHPDHQPDIDSIYSNALLDYHQLIDQHIGSLIAEAGPDTNVIILSDHGAGPYYKDVYLNEWLRIHGYLSLKNGGSSIPSYRKILVRLGLTRQNISLLLRKMHLHFVENWIKEWLGDRIDLLPRNERTEFPQAINWEKTIAYSFGYQGQIYINLVGREPNGIIEPGDQYDQILDELTAQIKTLTDPDDGELIVDKVYRCDEIFSGPFIKYAPDLTLVMRNLSYNTRNGYEFSPNFEKIVAPTDSFQSGSHRLDGILFASGPDILKIGYHSKGESILDLAPTILHLLNCPIPDNMDGNVLVDLLTIDREPQIIPTPTDYQIKQINDYYSEEDEEEVLDRLKKLGYLG